MQHTKAAMIASALLLIFAYIGIAELMKYRLDNTQSLIVAAIIWLICIGFVRRQL